MESLGLIITCMLGTALSIGIICSLLNSSLPIWFCHKLGWHLAPTDVKSHGNFGIGTCPRCGARVSKDSQGNWFNVH